MATEKTHQVLYNGRGEPKQVTSIHDPELVLVKERMKKYYEFNKDEKDLPKDMEVICLALATYDYCGAPSNWEPKFNNEKTIWNWAKWCGANRKKELKEIIKSYSNNKIPNASDLMLDYFT